MIQSLKTKNTHKKQEYTRLYYRLHGFFGPQRTKRAISRLWRLCPNLCSMQASTETSYTVAGSFCNAPLGKPPKNGDLLMVDIKKCFFLVCIFVIGLNINILCIRSHFILINNRNFSHIFSLFFL